jgi:hypothetical protein
MTLPISNPDGLDLETNENYSLHEESCLVWQVSQMERT